MHPLLFVPLGGCNEIGLNLNLYGYGPEDARQWLMVDLGVTFGNKTDPGVDVILPDPTFIAEQKERLAGLLLTHAHEDHLGAVAHLWPRLRCPVYGTAFTLALLKRKLAETGLTDRVPLTELPMNGRCEIGPFSLRLVTLTHSIPEPSAVIIRTPAGTVVHTGDWKLDPDPVVGERADEAALKRVGDDGVLALVCDSTNVFEPGTSGSEGALQDSLTQLIARCDQRVVITSFSTNVARLQTIAAAARANNRDVVVAGASLWRVITAAKECGYLADAPAFVEDQYAGYFDRNEVVIVCTGSQGEPRAALSRMVYGTHPNISLEADDTVIFSSRIIPGNEVAIGRLQNAMARDGIRLITAKDAFVHVSGHPARDELARMYALVRPRLVVPVHGEARHLREHAAFAKTCRVAESIVPENGAVVRLAPGRAEIIDMVPTGRLAVDGKRLVTLNGTLARERNRAMHNGTALVTVVVNGRASPNPDLQLSTVGLLDDDDEETVEAVRYEIANQIDGLSERTYNDDGAMRESIRLTTRRAFHALIGKKPVTHVHLVRLEEQEGMG